MPRRVVDLASHLNRTVGQGHPADFPIALKPVYYVDDQDSIAIPHRLAVVREDTGHAIALVSDRYTLIRHQEILDIIEKALRPLDLGPVPRGIYVDRQGARMRAIFKFPSLAQPVVAGDDLCPCLQVRNTYDGTARIAIHLGAFRFVCTNLAVGGGGVFAGGFMAIHAGTIPLDDLGEQLARYLERFDEVMALYRHWADRAPDPESLTSLVESALHGRPQALGDILRDQVHRTVFAAYNVATDFATHRMRSATAAFALLERINAVFQRVFPMPGNQSQPAKDPTALAFLFLQSREEMLTIRS